MVSDIRIAKAAKGDRAAWEEIVREQHPRLYPLCLRMMASPQDAMDMEQEIWIKVWRSLPSFKGDSSLSTWLYRITMNTCLDELRRRKKKAQISLEALSEEGWEAPDPEGEKLLERSMNRELIRQALEKLPPDYKAALLLRDREELSYEGIASILNIPIGTVRSRISRGRKAMAKILLELEPDFLNHV